MGAPSVRSGGFWPQARAVVVSVPMPAGETIARFRVWPAAPNPSLGPFHVDFDLPARARVQVSVFDLSGRRVRRVFEGQREPGRHRVLWDGRDDSGRNLARSLYGLVVEDGSRTG